MVGAICGPSRGRWSRPFPIDGNIKFVDEDGRPCRKPYLVSCEHRDHWAPRGRKRFKRSECYAQRWELTEKEFWEAIRDNDIFSLDMRPRFLCPKCTGKENQG